MPAKPVTIDVRERRKALLIALLMASIKNIHIEANKLAKLPDRKPVYVTKLTSVGCLAQYAVLLLKAGKGQEACVAMTCASDIANDLADLKYEADETAPLRAKCLNELAAIAITTLDPEMFKVALEEAKRRGEVSDPTDN